MCNGLLEFGVEFRLFHLLVRLIDLTASLQTVENWGKNNSLLVNHC